MNKRVYKLKDICHIKSGKRIPLGMEFSLNKTEHPYIRARDIKDGKINTDDMIYIDDCVFKRIQRYIIQTGDIAITIVGASVGNVAYADKAVDRYNLTENAVRLTSFSDQANAKYVFYQLVQKQFHDYMQTVAGGAAQPKLGIYKVERIKVVLPSRNQQDKIVNILNIYNNLIEVNNKRIKVLEQMAENLYKEWFVRFRFPGHENAEFENGIPKGWEYCTVGALSSVLQRGISPDYDDEGELTVISQKCIRQNIMDINEARKQTKSFKPELNLIDGDTVICSTGTGTLGRVGQVYGDFPDTTFDSHVTLVRAKAETGKHFLFWTLKELQPWFMNMGIGSTNQQELYRGTIKNAKALKPEGGLISKFERAVEPIHRSIISLIHSQENLVRQRDLLLPRLMSGKLEV